MTRIRTRSQFNFDSASRQLDTRDLDHITDPTTDLGAAVESAVLEYGTAPGLDLLPALGPGYDIQGGSIEGPLSMLGSDYSDLAAAMGKADGYEEYPAVLPNLGSWETSGDHKINWVPAAPGVYQWYAHQVVDLTGSPTESGSKVGFRQPLPNIMGDTWGADVTLGVRVDSNTYHHDSQGMLMASEEMLDAGYGGLQFFSPWYGISEEGVTVGLNELTVVILAWNPGSLVAYMGDI